MFIYHYFFVKQVEGKVSDLEKQKKYGSTVVIICGSELATLQYSIVNKYSIVQNNRYLIFKINPSHQAPRSVWAKKHFSTPSPL